MTMADKIIIMKDGLVHQVGVPQEVYDRPNNMFVAGFIGSPAMNFIDVKVTSDLKLKNGNFTLDIPDHTMKVIKENNLVGKDIVLGIRPEDLEDSAFVPSAGEGNTINAMVEVTEPMGAEVYVYIDIKGVLMTARVNPKTEAKNDKPITLFVNLEKLHIFDKENEKAYI